MIQFKDGTKIQAEVCQSFVNLGYLVIESILNEDVNIVNDFKMIDQLQDKIQANIIIDAPLAWNMAELIVYGILEKKGL